MEAVEDTERRFELSGAVTHLFNHYRTKKDGWDHFFYFFVIEQKLLKPALVPSTITTFRRTCVAVF